MTRDQASRNGLVTVVDLLQRRAAETPDHRVYTSLGRAAEPVSITCGELWTRVRGVAASLQRSCSPGDRVLLLYPNGLDFVSALFGTASAGLIAMPAPPPDPARLGRTVPRLRSMVGDAEPTLVLAATGVREGLSDRFHDLPDLNGLPWLSLDELAATAEPDAWVAPEAGADTVAYLQYTSGSTASPKGVMVSHANVLHNSELIRTAWRYDQESVALTWVPNFHDDGLVHGIVQPLFSGGISFLMEPMDFIGRPVRWLEAISRYGVTHTGGPDFAYALSARKIDEDQRAGLDLRSWRMAYNAAEPIRPDTLRGFIRAFAPCGFDPTAFFPSFGLAESTLLVSTAAWGTQATSVRVHATELERHNRIAEAGPDGREIMGCGLPVLDTEIVIVEPETCEPCAPDEVGEVWIRSGSVARGYWGRDAETERIFGARLRGDADARRFLRTGDLGFMRAGELHITGRHKDLIIIRGRNIYPQDVEQTVEACHDSFRPGCGAAFGVGGGAQERLVVAQEVRGADPVDADALARTVRTRLAEAHDVELEALVLIRQGTVPKTSSGKIRRHACRTAYMSRTLDVVGQWRRPRRRAPHTPESGDGRLHDTEHLLAWLRTFAGEGIDWRQVDERRSFPPHLVIELGNRGVLGLQVAREQGGLGLAHAPLVRVLRQLGAIDLTLATFVAGHNALGLRPIQRFGAPALQNDLVRLMATGRSLGAFALTEPGAGSDPRAMAATATPEGERWILRGSKLWSGSAGWAGVIHVFANLLDAEGRRTGTAAFAVPADARGLHVGSEAATMGLRGMTQNEVHLDGVVVSRDRLLGTVGDGMAVAEDAMLFTRLCLAAVSVGGAMRCAQLMVRYASRRSVATGRLLDNPVSLQRLTDLVMGVRVVEALVSEVALALDEGANVPEEAYAALKVAGPELLWRAADDLVQMLGGRGYLEGNVAPRMLRDARVFRVFEGPTEAIQMWLGASVHRDPGAADDFLRRRLRVPHVADRLAGVREDVLGVEAENAGARPDRIAARQWVQYLLGEVATSALVWGALRSSRRHGPENAPVEVWAGKRFEAAAERARAGARAADRLGVEDVRSAVEGFAAEIGDSEPARTALDLALDPLLAHGGPDPADAASPADDPRAVAARVDHGVGPDPTAVRAWLVDFCCRELELRPEEVDVHQPFVSLGLNSVTAVAMADQLGEWLGEPAERTLAWQYPSIEAVARHLGRGPDLEPVPPSDTKRHPDPEASEGGEIAEVMRILAEVEGLSDEQARSALHPDERSPG